MYEGAGLSSDVNIRDLEYEGWEMISELVGKQVTIEMGITGSNKVANWPHPDTVNGTIVEIQASWLKLMENNKPIYINVNLIRRIVPQ